MGFTAKPKTLYGDDLNHGRNQETDGYVQLPTRLEAEVTGRLHGAHTRQSKTGLQTESLSPNDRDKWVDHFPDSLRKMQLKGCESRSVIKAYEKFVPAKCKDCEKKAGLAHYFLTWAP